MDTHSNAREHFKIISLKDQYLWSKKSFPFFAENMTIRSILNLWWHSEIVKLILGVVRGMFTKRLKGTRRLYTLNVSKPTTPTMIVIEFRFSGTPNKNISVYR